MARDLSCRREFETPAARGGAFVGGRVLLMIRTGGQHRFHEATGQLNPSGWRQVTGEATVTRKGELDEAALVVSTADTTADLVLDNVFLERLRW